MSQFAISRRHALAGLAAPAILRLRAARAGAPVKVGLIMTTSGPFASSGDMMNKAADLFMASKVPAILGAQKLELIKRDDGGPNPEAAKRLVQELVVRDRVQYLGGIQWSPNANAVAPLVTQAKIPCVIMNAGTSQTVRLSPYVTRTSHTVWQSAYPMGAWAARNKLRRVYTLVTDFTGGIDAEQGFTKALTDGGGTVVASVRMPIQSPDFVPFLQRVKDTKPEAVFVFHPGGSQTAPFLRAAAEVQLLQSGISLIGTGDITSDEELPGTGSTAVGVITTHHYSAAADRPANKEFLELWHKAYGTTLRPNYMAVGVWDGLHVICACIAATKGEPDLAGAMAVIKGYHDAGSPRGPISIDPDTRDIVQNEYVREVRMVDGQPWNIEFETIPAVKDPWKAFNPS
jgi:branched-chain amino acid transport system substrate-binding protein